jgi:hypothetical protein
MQTLGWFTATIIGVGLFSGKFLQWHTLIKSSVSLFSVALPGSCFGQADKR